jgi:Caspase domain
MHNGKLVEIFNRAAPVASQALASQNREAAASADAASTSAGSRDPSDPGAVTTRMLRLVTQAQVRAPALKRVDVVEGQADIELVPGENVFSAIGFNAAGSVGSRPVIASVSARLDPAPPRVFILTLGINRFMASEVPALGGAVRDADDLAKAVAAHLAGPWKGAPVTLLTLHDQEATRAGLEAVLQQLQQQMRPQDLLVWFVATHGVFDSAARFGFVLHDWSAGADSRGLFTSDDILDASRRIRAFQQLVILDTCHAGAVNSLVRGLYDARLTVLARSMGLHVFASASDTQQAIDNYKGNGLFTHVLLQSMAGASGEGGARPRGTVEELGESARRMTATIAQQLGRRQEPIIMNFGKDVILYEPR